MTKALCAIVLAAGKGTRMRSSLPKVLHQLGGKTILEHVLHALQPLNLECCFVVVGYEAARVRAALTWPELHFVEQTEQLGTGHAVQQVLPRLDGYRGDVLVVNGDAPLLRPETLKELVKAHRREVAQATLLTADLPDPRGYGRVFLDSAGYIQKVIEDRDCTASQQLNHRVNAGLYCFDWPRLVRVLPTLQTNNAQGERYLPDVLAALSKVAQVSVSDSQEVLGINDRVHLAEAGRILNRRTLERLMRGGVTIVDPQSTTIDDTVEIGEDVLIEPQTHLRGRTRIAPGCRIGPGTLIENSEIEADTEVVYSVLRDTRVGARTTVGPYANLHHGTTIGSECRVGNFVEMKNSTLGNQTKTAHLSYLGDAILGNRVNIGAGTITANYDGKHKHRTELADGVKTGANTVLVAPLHLGAGVNVAAGSTVTEDAQSGLVIARARQVNKPDWTPPYERQADA